MIKIGRLDVSLERRQLYLQGRPIRVGTRAFDVLQVLIEAGGKLASKEEIFRRVWPETIVEESNLQVHISSLRKMLGDDKDLIKTIPGRGYCLTCPNETEGRTGTRTLAWTGKSASKEALQTSNVPLRHTPLIGRETALGDVKCALGQSPLVTLVGTGGVGKTQLGLEVARVLNPLFAEVRCVDLSTAERPGSTLNAIANGLACGSSIGTVTATDLIHAIGCRKMLVMLDNCEHVILETASICEQLVESNPNLRILVTSREPLRARFEQIYRVAPLEVPSEEAGHDDILGCSAAHMFMSRARAYDPRFQADAENITLIGTLCRRLDGLPLALELAAAQVAARGIRDLVAQLDNRFRVLAGGHRTAPAQQQTLKAALDRSHQFLCQRERIVLRRIGVFRGAFALNAACEVVAREDLAAADVTEAIAGLVAKSLLTSRPSGSFMTYYLLETTRAYALQMLAEAGESEIMVRRHEYYLRTCGAVTHEFDATDASNDRARLAIQDS
ncbi:winged helix-turn-helix domain-containing protein [Paraburkholderia sp. BL23I1N1]|uniref:winged helix-turn-helix domain-containing protein n=1 Tax=Paraburkholderia sp. BL23I1N1 TaxID=1938802 RepID=UPI001604885E|nr:winged helix-turn-helix domain-containing protein [Paraburkholderia sp. BL23I1N1]